MPGAGEAAHLRAPSQHRAGRPSAEPACPPDQAQDGGAGRHERQQPQEASCCREGGEEDETLEMVHRAGTGLWSSARAQQRGGWGKGGGEKRPHRGAMWPGHRSQRFSAWGAQRDGEKGFPDLPCEERLEEPGCDGLREAETCCGAGRWTQAPPRVLCCVFLRTAAAEAMGRGRSGLIVPASTDQAQSKARGPKGAAARADLCRRSR